jgi:hypothetical protein
LFSGIVLFYVRELKMKVLNPKRWGTAFGAGLLATIALIPQAKGELVYEDGPAAKQAQVDDRLTMRQAISVSEKAQATQQAEAVAAQPMQPVQMTVVAPTTVEAPASMDISNMSKAELMRRERQREELKNEDILQERLEELRLRDERRRTDEVLGVRASTGAPAPQMAGMALKEEIVMSPVTDHAGTPGLAPAMAPAASVSNATLVGTPVAASSETSMMAQSTMSVAPGMDSTEKSEHTMISVAPRAGISNMTGDGTYFTVSPHFGAGVSAAIGASEYFTFQVGYTFNQYGVSMNSNNPFVRDAQFQAGALGQNSFQSLNMNQNLFDAGMKVHLLSSESKIRPFVGGGGAYGRSYINFSQVVINQMNSVYGTNVSPDYTLSNFLAFLSAGMDFKVAKNIAVGADFRYYAVLSDSQSGYSNAYNYAFTGGYNGSYFGGAMGANPLTSDTAVAGNALARNSFYSIMGSVTFSF